MDMFGLAKESKSRGLKPVLISSRFVPGLKSRPILSPSYLKFRPLRIEAAFC